MSEFITTVSASTQKTHSHFSSDNSRRTARILDQLGGLEVSKLVLDSLNS